MAAPSDMTARDISGKYTMDKSLSDDNDEILRLQGVSWWTRKAISVGTLYLDVKHTVEDDVEHIEIVQKLSGLKGTLENRILDGEARPHEDHVFGPVLSKSQRIPLDDIEHEYLKKDWLEETLKDGNIIYTRAQSDTAKSGKTWTAEQAWGFEQINGEKRYTRHVHFVGPGGEIIEIRLVYNYLGPL